jgi:predicted homoserine dehydrogenase-like protein
MGDGPYFALYRPYHLTSLETPISIARAVMSGDTTVATDTPPTTETVAVAKRDLKAGETIDGLGGFSVYGIIETAAETAAAGNLPIGLAPGAVLTSDVATGETITYSDVKLDDSLTIVQLRRVQDGLLAG